MKAVSRGSKSAGAEIERHLDSGHLALLLIERWETGHLHWVLASRLNEGQLKIFDSLADEPYPEPTAGFLENHIVSALLVKPAGIQPNRSSLGALLAGSGEIIRFLFRLGKSEKS